MPEHEAERLEELKADKGLAASFVRTFALPDLPTDVYSK